MSGRNRGPPLPMKGIPHSDLAPVIPESHFARGLLGPMPPHPGLLEEMRRHPPPHPHPHPHPHPAIMEERLAVQHQDIQGLLADNQRLAATHVALKQELEAAQHELQRMSRFADSLNPENDVPMRELHDKCLRLESECRDMEAMRGELHHVYADIKELNDVRQDLTGRVQAMTHDLARYNADLQQVPALKAEIESMKQELHRARAAIEYEKKGYAENYEHGQMMEKKLVAMSRELEKLRAEIANAEKRARAAAAAASAPVVGNPGVAYNAHYGYPEAAYAGNSYPMGYGMNSVPANAENYPQYGVAPGSWGAYDMQRAQGHK